MSNAKHTPGPWRVLNLTDGSIRSADGQMLVRHFGGNTNEEAEANARGEA